MRLRRAGRPQRSALSIVILAAAPLAAAALGYAFYAPPVGETAAGQTGKAAPEQPRDRAEVRAEARMASRPGPPTLKDVVRFHGLEDDSLACTIEENYGSIPRLLVPTYERRPLRAGEEIILCLD